MYIATKLYGKDSQGKAQTIIAGTQQDYNNYISWGFTPNAPSAAAPAVPTSPIAPAQSGYNPNAQLSGYNLPTNATPAPVSSHVSAPVAQSKSLIDIANSRPDVLNTAKSQGGDPFTSGTKANTWLNDWWNTAGKNEYPGTSLIQPPLVPDPNNINTHSDMYNATNGGQQATADSLAPDGTVPTRKTTADIMKEISNTVAPKTTDASGNIVNTPDVAPPNYTDIGNNARASSGVSALEAQSSSLQAEARDIQAISRQRTAAERGKTVATNVIEGRVSQEDRQTNERLSLVNDSIKTISDQLNTAYKNIDTLMQTTQMTYEAATAAHDKAFSQNLQLYNLANGINEQNQSLEQTNKSNANANLKTFSDIISTGITAGTLDPATLPEDMKLQITKLEMQSGLPVGSTMMVINSLQPGQTEVLKTVSDDNTMYSVLIKNADGTMTTKTYPTGLAAKVVKASGSGGGTGSAKPLSSTLTTRYYLPTNTTQGDYNSVLSAIGALQSRNDLTDMEKWDAAAKAITAAGGDPTTWDAILWENFSPEGLKGYLDKVKNVKPATNKTATTVLDFSNLY